MKTYITTNPNTPTGYEVTVEHDDGRVEHLPIVKKEPDRETNGAFDWYILPENPANRKMVNGKKIHDGMQLTYRETRTQTDSTRTTKSSTANWTKFLTDEEIAIIEDIKAKATKRAEKAKLVAQIEADKARLAELEAEE